jgi:hypothetical protein
MNFCSAAIEGGKAPLRVIRGRADDLREAPLLRQLTSHCIAVK